MDFSCQWGWVIQDIFPHRDSLKFYGYISYLTVSPVATQCDAVAVFHLFLSDWKQVLFLQNSFLYRQFTAPNIATAALGCTRIAQRQRLSNSGLTERERTNTSNHSSFRLKNASVLALAGLCQISVSVSEMWPTKSQALLNTVRIHIDTELELLALEWQSVTLMRAFVFPEKCSV